MTNRLEHFDLQKTRLCSDVVLAWANNGEFKKAETLLKSQLGTGWSATAAFQFMSGKKAKAALETESPRDQIPLLLAHYFAKEICAEYGLGAIEKPDQVDRDKLFAMIKSRQRHLQ